MRPILRWVLAYLGTIFLLVFALFAGLWAADGFVGGAWAVLAAPFLYTPLIGLALIAPAALVDRVLVAFDVTTIGAYGLAGAALVLAALGVWTVFDGRGAVADSLAKEWRGLVLLMALGAVAGALFKLLRERVR